MMNRLLDFTVDVAKFTIVVLYGVSIIGALIAFLYAGVILLNQHVLIMVGLYLPIGYNIYQPGLLMLGAVIVAFFTTAGFGFVATIFALHGRLVTVDKRVERIADLVDVRAKRSRAASPSGKHTPPVIRTPIDR